MAGENWYYTSGGQQVGPVAINDIQARIAAGQLTAQDHVWRDGMANWLPIASVPELAGYSGGAGNPYQQQQQYAAQGGYSANPYGGQPLGYGGYQAPYGQARQGAYSGKATTAFVLSLVGLFCFGVILGPVAIGMGATASSAMNRTGDTKGKGLAIAAIVIGIVDLIGFVVYLVYLQSHDSPFGR